MKYETLIAVLLSFFILYPYYSPFTSKIRTLTLRAWTDHRPFEPKQRTQGSMRQNSKNCS